MSRLESHPHCIGVLTQGDRCVPVPLKKVASKKKFVPLDHDWIASARRVGTCPGVSDAAVLELMGTP